MPRVGNFLQRCAKWRGLGLAREGIAAEAGSTGRRGSATPKPEHRGWSRSRRKAGKAGASGLKPVPQEGGEHRGLSRSHRKAGKAGASRLKPLPQESGELLRQSRSIAASAALTGEREMLGLPSHPILPRSEGESPDRQRWQGYGILARMKVREVLELLESHGWQVIRQKGSHRQLQHPTRLGTVTVAGKPGVDIPPGTLNSILKQAGLKN